MKNFFRGLICAVFVGVVFTACSGAAGGADGNSVNQTEDFYGEAFTISYDANGGEYWDSRTHTWKKDVFFTQDIRFLKTETSHTIKVASYILDSSLRFPKKTFAGWATSPNATEAEYYRNDEIQLTSNLRLYAVWSDIQLSLSSSVAEICNAETVNVSIEALNLGSGKSYGLEMRIVKNIDDLHISYPSNPVASGLYRLNISRSKPNVEQQIKISYDCPEGDYIICAELKDNDKTFSIKAQKNLTIKNKPTLRLSLENNALSTYKKNQSLITYTVAKSENSDDTDNLKYGGFFYAQKGDVVKKIAITRNSNTAFYNDTNTASWPVGTYDSIEIDNTWEIGTWTGWVELQNPTDPPKYYRKSEAVTFTVGYNVFIPEVEQEFYVTENKFRIPLVQDLGIDTSDRDWLYWGCWSYEESGKANDGDEITLYGHTTLNSCFKYHNPPKIIKVEFFQDCEGQNGSSHLVNWGKIYLDPNEEMDIANERLKYIVFKFGLTDDVSQAYDDTSGLITQPRDDKTAVGENPYVLRKFPCSKSPCKQTVYVFAKRVKPNGCSDFVCKAVECDVENLANPKDFEIYSDTQNGNNTLKFNLDPRSWMVRFYYSESKTSEKKLFARMNSFSRSSILLKSLFSDLKQVASISSVSQFPEQFTYWIEAVDDCSEMDVKDYYPMDIIEAWKNFYGTTSEIVEIPILKGARTVKY